MIEVVIGMKDEHDGAYVVEMDHISVIATHLTRAIWDSFQCSWLLIDDVTIFNVAGPVKWWR